MLSAIGSRLGGLLVSQSVPASTSFALRALDSSLAQMSSQTPPPDAARGATADLCDTFIKDPVDIVNQGNVQIMQPLFSDFGGHLRFKGQAATVKCFENNPLVRKVWQSSTAILLTKGCLQQSHPHWQHNWYRPLRRMAEAACSLWTVEAHYDVHYLETTLQQWLTRMAGV